MIKGHLRIDLRNEKTGKRERFEQDNMVTNALQYLIPPSMHGSVYINERYAPIAKVALGGILLFDGPITEDPENIYFPSDVHLTGCAGRTATTSTFLQGSLNVTESGPTDTGFTSVWDFGTSQGNGKIEAIALTHAAFGIAPINPYYSGIGFVNSANSYPIYYDKAHQIMYHCRYSSGILHFYKQKFPLYSFGVADDLEANISYPIEEISQVEMPGELWGCSALHYGQDGFFYIIFYGLYNNIMTIRRIALADLADPKVETVCSQYAISNVKMNTGAPIVSKGYVYFGSDENMLVYKMKLDNLNDVTSYEMTGRPSQFLQMPNGGVTVIDGGKNKLLYPDGTVVETDVNESLTVGVLTNGIFLPHGGNGNTVYTNKGYLGTICNLGAAVTKTVDTTMKITYTLTDAE